MFGLPGGGPDRGPNAMKQLAVIFGVWFVVKVALHHNRRINVK